MTNTLLIAGLQLVLLFLAVRQFNLIAALERRITELEVADAASSALREELE
jgi:hypothetical protein